MTIGANGRQEGVKAVIPGGNSGSVVTVHGGYTVESSRVTMTNKASDYFYKPIALNTLARVDHA